MLGCSENSEELKANNNFSIQQMEKENRKNEKKF